MIIEAEFKDGHKEIGDHSNFFWCSSEQPDDNLIPIRFRKVSPENPGQSYCCENSATLTKGNKKQDQNGIFGNFNYQALTDCEIMEEMELFEVDANPLFSMD